MKDIKIRIHWSFLILIVLMIVCGKFQEFLCCLICAILHEMGHSIVGKKLGYKLNIITLMPYGAMLSGKNSIFFKDDEIKIAIAGPLVNAVLITIFSFLWLIFPKIYNLSYQFVVANVYTLVFNLLPVYPLDGGRVLKAVLSKKIGNNKANKITKVIGYVLTLTMFLLFFVSFIFKLNYMLGINALFMLIGLFEDNSEVYYQKISNFEKFRFASNGKIINLSKNSNIFDAYKSIVEKNAKFVFIEEKKYSKNTILNYTLKYPLDTKLLDINV